MDLDSINYTTYAHASRDEYLALRDELEQMTSELERLQKQREATARAGKQSGSTWRDLFRASRGKADTRIRQLQSDEHAMQAEVGQLDELITELAPQTEAMRIKAAGARTNCRRVLWRSCQQHAQQQLREHAEAMLATESGQAFLAAFRARLQHTEREALDDDRFMVAAGFDTPFHDGWYASIAHFPNDQQARLRQRLTDRENAMLADLFRVHLNDATVEPRPESLTLPDRLDCEAPEDSYSSPLAIRQDLMALESNNTNAPA